jgi:hypothetical protein
MTQNGNRRRPWLADIGVLAAFILASVVLECVGVELWNRDSLGDGWGISRPWMWVFCFPMTAASALGYVPVANALIWLNPFIYGAMWWAVWRMFRLMRTKPSERVRSPLHNE